MAIGFQAGRTGQGVDSIAIGRSAGQTTQADLSVAIGLNAGTNLQSTLCVAIGREAGFWFQGQSAVAVGALAGRTGQGVDAVAVGRNAGNNTQGTNSVAIGVNAGQTIQSTNNVAIGIGAGQTGQAGSSVAVGQSAGNQSQGVQTVAVGSNSARVNQGNQAIAMGRQSGEFVQGSEAVCIGFSAGNTAQGSRSVAVGSRAGQWTQSSNAVAVGYLAGNTGQGQFAVGVGAEAGLHAQGQQTVGVGYRAGNTGQGQFSIAIGAEAGYLYQNQNSIAIGYRAGRTNQAQNSIVISARSTALEAGTTGFFVSPVRFTGTLPTFNLAYDPTLSEIVYTNSNSISTASANAVQYNNGGAFASTANFIVDSNTSNATNVPYIALGRSSTTPLFVNGPFVQGSSPYGLNVASNAGTNSYFGYVNTGRFMAVDTNSANTCALDFHSRDATTPSIDYDARILSSNGSAGGTAGRGNVTLYGGSYTFDGVANSNGVGTGAATQTYGDINLGAFINYNRFTTNNNATNFREYDTSKRMYNGLMLKGGTEYRMEFYGEGNYPLYGMYFVYFMNKAGQCANYTYMVMQGSVGDPGNTNIVTWSKLSENVVGGTTLQVTVGNVAWLPTITFRNNSTTYNAWFMVTTDVFTTNSVWGASAT